MKNLKKFVDSKDFVTFHGNVNSLKQKVIRMLKQREEISNKRNVNVTPVWQYVMNIMKYLLNLSTEDLINIRYHTGMITGDHINKYWDSYPPIDPNLFADELGYSYYIKNIPKKFWLSETDFLGHSKPIGVNYKNRIINKDICRYQCCVSNLYLTKCFDKVDNDKSIILEVGSGYGGLANVMSRLFDNKVVYVMVDIPEMLMCAGSLLFLHNPDKKIYIYDENNFGENFLKKDIYNYDFVLLPNFSFDYLNYLEKIDLMINIQSFQEMSKMQVNNYLKLVKNKLQGCIYSDNMDCMPINNKLGDKTITFLLKKYFDIFPNPNIYYEKIPDSNKSWFYKCYIGTGIKNKSNFEKKMKIARWDKQYNIEKKNNFVEIKIKSKERKLKRYI